MSKFLFVVGGVISGTGKGVAAASMGLLLRQRGHRVALIKFDPYLNISAGIIRPGDHGECFLCDDGTECDLDLGHYYRIAGTEVNSENICTCGTLYKELVEEQEKGKYLGATLQLMPHITQKVKDRLQRLGAQHDIVIAEIGGTVGDAESYSFFEAIRQFKQENPNDVLLCMVAPILWINTIKEFKTKPLQNSIRDLRAYGLNPDVLLCRVDRPVPEKILDKVSEVTGIVRDCVIDAPDVQSIYQVPIELYNRHVDDLLTDKFQLKRNGCRIHRYKDLVERYIGSNGLKEITVGIVGKYDNCDEAYLSLKEAIYHAAVANNVKAKIKWVSSAILENARTKEVGKWLSDVDGVVVPGGFDNRGVLGKVKAISYCRENKVPFLGICLGLQCAVIEFAQSVCGLREASSIEFNPKTPHPVIHFVEGQEALEKKCGTMRLGAFDCELARGSLAHALYGKKVVRERHRHRYEVNSKYIEQLANKGLWVTGHNPDNHLVEIMELDKKIHPFFLGTQAHPEFTSRLEEPNPLFFGFVGASCEFNRAAR